MGLIKCADCGGDISEVAAACPKCGRPQKGDRGWLGSLADPLKFIAIPIVGLLFTWSDHDARKRDATVRQLIDLYDRAASTNATDQLVALHACMDLSRARLLDERALGAVHVLLATTSHRNVVQRAGEICRGQIEEARRYGREKGEIIKLANEALAALARFEQPARPVTPDFPSAPPADSPEAARSDVAMQVASAVGKTLSPRDSAGDRERGAQLLEGVAQAAPEGPEKSRLVAQADLLRSPEKTPVFIVAPTTNMPLAVSLSNSLAASEGLVPQAPEDITDEKGPRPRAPESVEIRCAKPVDGQRVADLRAAVAGVLSVEPVVMVLDPEKVDIFPGQIEVWFPGTPLAGPSGDRVTDEGGNR